MDTLARKIKEKIEGEGPLTFAAFMEMALYFPGLGYYTSRETDIGRSGDFYTSPHLHYAFGHMLGRQIEEMWEWMGRPSSFDLVEVGGGRGYLCKDIMDSLAEREIYKGLSCTIVEINPYMAQRQKELLKGHEGKIRWVSSISEISDIRGCVLSNEVLDALPVHLVEMQDELREIYVTVDEQEFREQPGPPRTGAVEEYLREFFIQFPPGYRTELNLALKDWLGSVSRALSEGFVLTVDYGYSAGDYYHEERTRGTLMCYHRHQHNEDPYSHVGKQDITAHVNFSAVKKWGGEMGLQPLGFCPQGTYLVSLGIDGLIAELYEKSPDYGFEVAKIKGLIFPGTMGESHKVMVQYKGKGSPGLRGFRMRNQVERL